MVKRSLSNLARHFIRDVLGNHVTSFLKAISCDLPGQPLRWFRNMDLPGFIPKYFLTIMIFAGETRGITSLNKIKDHDVFCPKKPFTEMGIQKTVHTCSLEDGYPKNCPAGVKPQAVPRSSPGPGIQLATPHNPHVTS